MDKPLICVDFDGTIFDGVGVYPGCIEKLNEFRLNHRVMVFSARDGVYREWMIAYLKSARVPYDLIGPVKPNAEAFIDDKGVHFDGDWSAIKCGY